MTPVEEGQLQEGRGFVREFQSQKMLLFYQEVVYLELLTSMCVCVCF